MISRIKKTLTVVPATIAEAATYLRSIGEKQKEINAIKREAKKAKEAFDKKIAELRKDRDAFFVSLFAFAAPRKKELTKDARSVKTDAGTFGWRWTTPMVELTGGRTDAHMIAELEKLGLVQYVRIVKELDREAMLRDRVIVPGVTYTQQDEFFAKPKMKKEEGKAEELVKATEAIDI